MAQNNADITSKPSDTVPSMYGEYNESSNNILNVERDKDPTFFDIQMDNPMYHIARKPMEDNEELAPFLDGTKPMNISLICKGIEVFNLLLSEFLEDADTFTNRIGGDKKSK